MIALRPATPADAERLRAWRNDPETRRWSFEPGEVGDEEHAAWLARKLADPRCVLWVAEADGAPIGQVRLDAVGDRAEVSIALAPEARGAGHAAEVLRRAAAEAAGALGVGRLVARVKSGNEASLGAFRRAGFAERDRPATGAPARDELVLELEL